MLTRQPQPFDLYRGAYSALLYLLAPLIMLRLLWPRRGKPGHGRRWPELLGIGQAPQVAAPIWLHAVSVGEVVAAGPVIRALRERYPEQSILLTTTTRTGADAAQGLLRDPLIMHRYAPLDFPGAVARFLNRYQPLAMLLMETELWPNQLAACRRRRMPVVLLNARLSERSCRRYQRFQGLFDSLAGNLSLLLCQHQDDADRFVRLGVDAARLQVTGSVKFDITYAAAVTDAGQALRRQLGDDRPVWIAASTHEGEDEQVLAAFARVRRAVPRALLILVPRHPQRFDGVFALCRSHGFVTVRRSDGVAPGDGIQVYLGDTMGELPLMFAASDLAFVGGSLVDVGGHNLLEPAALGKAALTGPHYFNFSDITRQLLAKGAVQEVGDAEALAGAVLALFADPTERTRMGAAGQAVVQENQGALQRTMLALETTLRMPVPPPASPE
ncbi:lipid IV(A) 3-deoxy-D-manno-octulosonic acid transferase [Alcanivorax sp. JB21]|uniref:lipid IV(A) 3-deoxy-D-manno-octulosonic acid transferase n=1 Tax=Alcanivorax limicola TaxID=2874102 RepID=UPI001CC05933|nr:lipid IV(A) 3-deoxy-D-manno-octulosonic acid transferase [Alcanivorax limicola]MBZ2190293.1 lipid IV(A) 3-deoxy-D-manno-octulosonic acid transferase [Alcanivorax limicola]